jgi:hypothetical protein
MGWGLDPGTILRRLMDESDPLRQRPIPFVYTGLHEMLTVICICGALALGFLQVFGESRRGTWLLLLHRPAPRQQLMLTKVAVGAALLLAAIGLPLLILALWAAIPGTHASPFDWRMTLQPLRLCCGATVIYLAAFLTALRNVRWYGSRLLPLVLAGLVMGWIGNIVWWVPAGWIMVLVADALYVAAIVQTSVSREYP